VSTYPANDGSIHIHTHIHDEAELRRIELEEERRKQERAERDSEALRERQGSEQRREPTRTTDDERPVRKDVTAREKKRRRSVREAGPMDTFEQERLAYAKTWRRGIVICLVLFVGLCTLFDAIPQIVGAAAMLLPLGPIAILILGRAGTCPASTPESGGSPCSPISVP